jgi:hypothetical protein
MGWISDLAKKILGAIKHEGLLPATCPHCKARRSSRQFGFDVETARYACGCTLRVTGQIMNKRQEVVKACPDARLFNVEVNE